MKAHRSTRSRVTNNAPQDNFNPGDALESLNAEIVQLEALAHAAGEAILQLRYPAVGKTRREFARLYTLVTKVAEEASAAVSHGEHLVARLGDHLQRRRAEA